MAEERGAELGAAPERRREPVWGEPRRREGAPGKRRVPPGRRRGRLHAQAPRAKLAAGGEQAWRARREPGSTGEGDGSSSAEGPESGADAVAAPRDPRRGQGTARCATRSGEAARSRRSQEKLHGSTRKEKSTFRNEDKLSRPSSFSPSQMELFKGRCRTHKFQA
uniref:uncharacterized protein n=1 Tax=Lonchura striata TaxID=40157 RepID=UPI000B4D3E56|nr:uncharacterized protein LOC110468377 [Lonchura striata domestica]